jgi:homoserine acetyltransferase
MGQPTGTTRMANAAAEQKKITRRQVESDLRAFAKKMMKIFDANRSKMPDEELEKADREARPILGK